MTPSVVAMIRPIAIAASLIALFAVAPAAAQAAPKSCQREGARLLAASGSTRVVAVKEKAQNSETRRDRIYGCWTATGRRFTLFLQRDFGLDLIERADIEIVDGRYIGIIRDFEGGVSESRTAATWDAQKHVAVRNSKPCDEVSTGDFSGVEDAVFFRKRRSRLLVQRRPADLRQQGRPRAGAAGREGRSARGVGANNRGFGPRLYWTADTTLKSLEL